MNATRVHSTYHRFIVLCLVILGLILVSSSQATAQSSSVLVVDIDGTITPVMANYVERGINLAAEQNRQAVILRMDTPGGLSSSTNEIIQVILGSQVPVVVYVAPQGARAASAGVYITYASHIAAMAPTTNIGSATPIMLNDDGSNSENDTLDRKIVNDAVAQIRGLAELRGRNVDWAEKAVREADNITAAEAQELGVIEFIAPDLPGLLTAIDGQVVETTLGQVTLQTDGAAIESTDMSVVEDFFQIVSDPTIAYLLLSLGMLGLFLEFSNPGAVLPGVAGAIFVLIGLFSLGSLNVSWAGILLMALGFLLFIIDVYVPSHGVLTIGGVVAFALGSLMLADSTNTPSFEISMPAILLVTGTLAAFFFFVASSVVRARLKKATTGEEGLRGMTGEVRQDINPIGYVFVAGELWRAVSPEKPMAEGELVRVVDVDGLTLTVAPLESTETPAQSEPAIDSDADASRRLRTFPRLRKPGESRSGAAGRS